MSEYIQLHGRDTGGTPLRGRSPCT